MATTQILSEIVLPGDGDTIRCVEIDVVNGNAFAINVRAKVGARTTPTLAAAVAHLQALGVLLESDDAYLADEEDQPDDGINIETSADQDLVPTRAASTSGARVTYDVK